MKHWRKCRNSEQATKHISNNYMTFFFKSAHFILCPSDYSARSLKMLPVAPTHFLSCSTPLLWWKRLFQALTVWFPHLFLPEQQSVSGCGRQPSQAAISQRRRAVKRWELWLHQWRPDDWVSASSPGRLWVSAEDRADETVREVKITHWLQASSLTNVCAGVLFHYVRGTAQSA